MKFKNSPFRQFTLDADLNVHVNNQQTGGTIKFFFFKYKLKSQVKHGL